MSIIILVVLLGGRAIAQVQGNEWSALMRLSSEEGTYVDRSTAMVADPYGNVHVFWAETGFEDGRSVIQHASFNGKDWTAPTDIFATDLQAEIGTISVTVDNKGQIYLVWVDGASGPVFYATAPAHQAMFAKAWSVPVKIDVSAFQPRLLVDDNHILHLIYSDFYSAFPGVYYQQSDTDGRTWTSPIWLDPDVPEGYAPLTMDAKLDDAGGIHVVWAYVNPENTIGGSVRYTHSMDGGQTWALPYDIDIPDESPDELRLSEPTLTVSGENVYVIWAGDASTHREFRFSTDAGQTWSVPIRIFGDFLGQALGDGTAADALGRVHFIGQLRWPQGLYHFYWDGRTWSAPKLFYLIQRNDEEGFGDRIHAHNVRLAIGQGNILVNTFSDGPGGALYALTNALDDVPALPIQPTPTLTPPPLVPTATAQPTATAHAQTILTPTALQFANPPVPANAGISSEFAIILGVGASLLLVVGIFIVQVMKRR